MTSFFFVVVLIGGVLGIMGAAVQEARAVNFLLVPFLGAPIVEEALKPIGVYIALIRWPQALRSQLFTALLAALAGLIFGIIESTVYVTLYVPDHSRSFLLYRFSVPLALHATASYLVGLGINYRVIDWAQGRCPLPRSSRNFYVAAVALHGLYNFTAIALTLSGLLNLN